MTGLLPRLPPGSGPRVAPPQPDFLQPRRALHPASWLILALAGAAALLAAVDARQAWQQRAQALQQVEDARQRLDRAQAAARRPAPRAAPSRNDPPVLLDHPWRDVFLAVEGASVPGIHWLAFEHDVEGSLRLEGETADAGAALQATEALRGMPGWRDVGLNRLERSDSPGGGQRFDIKARRTDVPARSAP